MIETNYEWWPLQEAAKHFKYTHLESLRNRLRVLRQLGKVVDLGTPPAEYKVGVGNTSGKVVLYWPNPNTALLRSDAPTTLLNGRRGKRSIIR